MEFEPFWAGCFFCPRRGGCGRGYIAILYFSHCYSLMVVHSGVTGLVVGGLANISNTETSIRSFHLPLEIIVHYFSLYSVCDALQPLDHFAGNGLTSMRSFSSCSCYLPLYYILSESSSSTLLWIVCLSIMVILYYCT